MREDHGRGIVLCVFARKFGIRNHRCAQHIVCVVIAPANAFIDGVFQAASEVIKPDVHANLQEHIDDAGVLAHGAMAHGAHFAVGQNLCDGIFGCWTLLAVVGASQMRDEIGRVVVTDVLQRCGYRFNQVFFFDQGRHVVLSRGLVNF